MPQATSDHRLKNPRWSLTVVLAAIILSHQPIGVHCLDNVVASGPLANRLGGQHRALQAYTSSATVQSLLLDAVNRARVKANVTTVCSNYKLLTAADLHSKDQAAHNSMSHTGSGNSTMVQRIEAQGFQWSALGENVAAGYSTVDAVMTGWMNSEGHKANILNPAYKFFGGGYGYNAASNYKHYWTQDFGAGSTEACDSPTPTPTQTPTPIPTTPTSNPTATPTATPASSSTSRHRGNGTKKPTLDGGVVVTLNGICGNDNRDPDDCVAGAYCQPWNAETYECIAVPEGSGIPEVNVDYFGDDINLVRDVDPHQCATECIKLSGCAAYTFVNLNTDGRTSCYLKSGKGTRTEAVGAISAVIAS